MDWNCDNMCDSGIQIVVDDFIKAAKDTIHDRIETVEKFDMTAPDREFRDGLCDLLTDDLGSGLESALESVVQSIDNHMETVKDEAIQSWLEHQEDYVPYEDVSEKEAEIEELEEKIEELEENQKEEILHQGLTLTWIPSKGKFICTVTGRIFELNETEDSSISMVQ